MGILCLDLVQVTERVERAGYVTGRLAGGHADRSQHDGERCRYLLAVAGAVPEEEFVDGVLAITASKPRLRGRLLLEITETQALKDLAAANAAIGRLRGAGHLICLDDYGAGAASLSYLRSLDVDFVKIDGRYVQRLVAGSRDATILKHLAALCRELGVTTIAEMIETPEVEAVVRDLGVDLGQGWQFAKPLAQPIWPPASPAVAARRQGVVEGWG